MKQGMPIQLSDDAIERMVRDRAGSGAPSDLTATIVELAAGTRQRRRSWLGVLDVVEAPRGRYLLAAALLALAVIGAVLAVVGSDLLRRADWSVAPSPPAPSALLVPTAAPTIPPPSPRVDASQSPVPSATPSSQTAQCGSTPPTKEPRVTAIDLPAHAYLRVTFAGCSVWVTNNRNGRGIHRVNIARNKVVGTILKGPIENPVYALRSDGDDLWALTWDDPAPIKRIDPVTGKPDKSIALPREEVGGGLWVLGGELWTGPDRWPPSGNEVHVIDLDTGAVTATLKDLVPYEMWRDADAVWAIARPADVATGAAESDMDLVRIDPSTYRVSRTPLARAVTEIGSATTRHGNDLFLAGPGEILRVSKETGEVVRRIPLDRGDEGALIASTGDELWALPIESKPLTNGFNNRSRQLVQIDPETGSVVRRVPIREIGVMDLFYGYGSLWILAPDTDYSQTFGMHLVRVELPAPA